MGAGVPCVSPTSEAPDHSLLLHITYLILCLLFNMMFPTVWVWVWVWVCVFLCVSVCDEISTLTVTSPRYLCT